MVGLEPTKHIHAILSRTPLTTREHYLSNFLFKTLIYKNIYNLPHYFFIKSYKNIKFLTINLSLTYAPNNFSGCLGLFVYFSAL